MLELFYEALTWGQTQILTRRDRVCSTLRANIKVCVLTPLGNEDTAATKAMRPAVLPHEQREPAEIRI